MNLRLNKVQQDILSVLLNKYENSATYKGENTKTQSFSIKPEKIFSEYNGDYTDQEHVNQFNRDVKLLADYNLIKTYYMKGIMVIEKITLNLDALVMVYQLLDRKDIMEKRCSEMKIYSKYMGNHLIIDLFCKKQIQRLEEYKDAEYSIDIAMTILKLLQIILNNKNDIMIRELSVAVFGDTKLFEKSFRSRICKIIEEYGDLEFDFSRFDEKEKKKIILEEYGVYANPSYVFVKGDMEIYYSDGSNLVIGLDKPIAISTQAINQISSIKVHSKKMMTVENLTSYNRMNHKEFTFLYLSGYHNSAKQNFLKRIAEDNKELSWNHFGDIDPDGYYILKNLIDKTGISFIPFLMGVEELQTYEAYCKPLEKNDLVKAKSLIKNNFYQEVMSYLLENNCKLEQEIISWLRESKISC